MKSTRYVQLTLSEESEAAKADEQEFEELVKRSKQEEARELKAAAARDEQAAKNPSPADIANEALMMKLNKVALFLNRNYNALPEPEDRLCPWYVDRADSPLPAYVVRFNLRYKNENDQFLTKLEKHLAFEVDDMGRPYSDAFITNPDVFAKEAEVADSENYTRMQQLKKKRR